MVACSAYAFRCKLAYGQILIVPQHHRHVAEKAETVTGQQKSFAHSSHTMIDSQLYSRRPPEYTTPGFTILLTSELIVGAVAVLPPVTLVDGFRLSVNGWLGLPDAACPREWMSVHDFKHNKSCNQGSMHVQ